MRLQKALTQTAGSPVPTRPISWLRQNGGALAWGFAAGVLLWQAMFMLDFEVMPVFRWLNGGWWSCPVTGAAGALLAVTRLRRALVAATALAVAGMLLITSTPLTGWLLRGLVRVDPLQRVEAVIVLTGGVRDNGEPGIDTAQRLMHAYELLQGGYARRLIVTRQAPPKPSHRVMVERHMRQLGFSWPIEEPERLVDNTHDEALAVAELARSRGWSRILLVTQPTHTRRASAVFEKAGVSVLSSPCAEDRYEINNPYTPGARLLAWGDLFRELLGTQIYRLRGWI